MVRKISMKRKHTNRRAKSKLAFRKTKKLVRKSQTRRRCRQIGGGGVHSKPSESIKKAEIDILLYATENDEPAIINRFEERFKQGTWNANSEVINSGETTPLLFYLVNNARSNPIIYHNLFRWLIEQGAAVDYVMCPDIMRITAYQSLMYTIVGNVIWVFMDVVQSICDNPAQGCIIYNSDGYVDVNKLYDLYNCIYTLVLLLSKNAIVLLVEIRSHTPLDVLNAIEITRIQTIIDEVSSLKLNENMDSMFPPAPKKSFVHVPTDEGLLEPLLPPPDITVTKEYVVPRLLLLFEPIKSLVDLARYKLVSGLTKNEDSLKEMVANVNTAAMTAVTNIIGLSPSTVSLPVSAPAAAASAD